MRNNCAHNVGRTGPTLDGGEPRADIAMFRPTTAESPSPRAPVSRSQPLSLLLLHLSAAFSGSPPRSHARLEVTHSSPSVAGTTLVTPTQALKVRAPVEPVST